MVPLRLAQVDVDNAEACELASAGNYEAAIAILDRVALAAPEHVQTWVNRGLMREDVDDFAGAAEDFGRAAALAPDEAEHPACRGRALYAAGDYREALGAYEQARARGGGTELFFEMGKCALRLGAWDRAEELFTRDIEEDVPGDMSFYNRHVARAQLGRTGDAIADLAEASERCDSPQVLFRMLEATRDLHLELGDTEGAMRASAEAIERLPNEPACYAAHAELHIQLGLYDQAIETATAGIDLAADLAGPYAARATALAMAGDSKRALADLGRAIELDPHDPKSLSNRGWLLQQSGEADAALEDYDRALSLAPEYTKALHNRLALLESLGRTQEAARDRAVLEALGSG